MPTESFFFSSRIHPFSFILSSSPLPSLSLCNLSLCPKPYKSNSSYNKKITRSNLDLNNRRDNTQKKTEKTTRSPRHQVLPSASAGVRGSWHVWEGISLSVCTIPLTISTPLSVPSLSLCLSHNLRPFSSVTPLSPLSSYSPLVPPHSPTPHPSAGSK